MNPDSLRDPLDRRTFVERCARYAFGLGCETSYAGEIVYSEGIDLKADAHVAKIGVACRICERANCHQRAVPPIDREIRVPTDRRKVVPFDLS